MRNRTYNPDCLCWGWQPQFLQLRQMPETQTGQCLQEFHPKQTDFPQRSRSPKCHSLWQQAEREKQILHETEGECKEIEEIFEPYSIRLQMVVPILVDMKTSTEAKRHDNVCELSCFISHQNHLLKPHLRCCIYSMTMIA